MYILLVGLNHTTAPLTIREKFAFTETKKNTLYASFRQTSVLESLLILSTCNRTELYAVARDKEAGKKDLCRFFMRQGHCGQLQAEPFIYAKACDEAVLHLYRVSSGLDSMILGETQILGQLKQAYAESREHGASGRMMNQLIQKAFFVGKKVRNLTAIDQHPVSVSYVAVQQAKKQSGGFIGKKVLVVGAGEAGQLTARYLKSEGVQAVFISNRSAEVAQKLARELGGTAVKFDRLAQYLSEVDIVISCTGASHLVIHNQECRQALENRGGKPVYLVDIAVPRDIDPALADIPGVQLWDMDRLQQVVLSGERERMAAAARAEAMVQQEMQAFRNWSASLHVAPVIAAMKARGEEIRRRELDRALNRLGREKLSEREKKVVMEMGRAIVNQLLRSPVENIKQFAEAGQGDFYAAAAKNLFSLKPMGEGKENGKLQEKTVPADWNPGKPVSLTADSLSQTGSSAALPAGRSTDSNYPHHGR